MAIKSLLLVPVTLCFLMLTTAAQGPDTPAIIANGTVICKGNSSADLEDVEVEVIVKYDNIRHNLGYNLTNTKGKVVIYVPNDRVDNLTRGRFIFPDNIELCIPYYEEYEETCPSGYEITEVYAESRFGNSLYIGYHKHPNGTLTFFREFVRI
ncbi:hypothetical protein EJB05_02636, partial [Eragrostis curvula]